MDDSPAYAGRPPIEGQYANVFQIGHNAFEFVIDFGQQYGDSAEAHYHTRIITSPAHIKSLMDTLATSLLQYKSRYGGDMPSAPGGGLQDGEATRNAR